MFALFGLHTPAALRRHSPAGRAQTALAEAVANAQRHRAARACILGHVLGLLCVARAEIRSPPTWGPNGQRIAADWIAAAHAIWIKASAKCSSPRTIEGDPAANAVPMAFVPTRSSA